MHSLRPRHDARRHASVLHALITSTTYSIAPLGPRYMKGRIVLTLLLVGGGYLLLKDSLDKLKATQTTPSSTRTTP